MSGPLAQGTAFFVTRGFLLTAAHVARNNTPLHISLHGKPFDAAIVFIEPETVSSETPAAVHPDVALLRVDCPPLPWYPRFELATPPTDALISMFGFGTDANVGGDPVTARFEGVSFHDDDRKIPVFRLKDGHMTPGLSGAPAYLEGSPSRIIGIAIETRHASFPFGGYVTPLSEFYGLLSDVLPSIDVVTSGSRPNDLEPIPSSVTSQRSSSANRVAAVERLIERAERERRQMRPAAALATSQEAVAMAESGVPAPLMGRVLRTNAIMLAREEPTLGLATALADRAIAFDEDTSADERVRAIIAFAAYGPDAALAAITPHLTSDLEIMRAAYLVDSAPAEARRIVLALPPSDTERPRARRIRLLIAIAERRMSEMITLAESLVVAAGEDYSIAYVVLVAFYLAGIPTPLWPPHVGGWPEPIPQNEITDTPEQRQRFVAAAAIADTLLRETELVDTERDFLELWRLGTLCLNQDTNPEAAAYARDLLDRPKPNFRALAWVDCAVLFSREELDAAVGHIAESVNTIDPEAEVIALLATMQIQTDKAASAEALLTEHARMFRTTPELSRFRSLLALAKALQGDISGAREVQEQITTIEERNSVETTIRLEDGPKETAHLRLYEFFLECRDPKVLLVAANLARTQGDWRFLAEQGPAVLAAFRNLATARLALYGAFNTQLYANVLELYAQLSEFKIPISADILRLRALSLDRLASNDALPAFDDLLRVDPNDNNLYSAGYAHVQRGDLPGTVLLARAAEESDLATPQTRLAFAMWIRPIDPELAKRLWRLSMPAAAEDDRLVLLAFTLSHDLGLLAEAAALQEPMHRLGLEGRGGVRLMDLVQVIATLKADHERADALIDRYRKGKISVHVLTSVLNTDLYNTHVLQPKLNREGAQRNGVPIFVRHGSRTAADPRQPLENVFLDTTSYLVAVWLNTVEALVDKRHVFVSRALGALLSDLLTDRTLEPTPERAARQALLKDLRADRFEIEKNIKGTIEAIAQRRGLVIVDWATPENESRYEAAGVPWCTPLDVVDWLRDGGTLGTAAYDRAIAAFGSIQERRGGKLSPGATLFLQFNVSELLYEAGIRSHLLSSRHVIPETYVVYLEREETKESRELEGAQWLRSAIDQLQHFIASNKITPLTEPAVPEGESETSLTIRAVRAAFSERLPKGSVVTVDDRQITGHFLRDDGVAIGSLWDILRALVDEPNGISLTTFFEMTIEMRRCCLMYIPVEEREILAVVRAAAVTDSGLTETEEMRVLERYVAAALLDTDALYARGEENSGPDAPQMAFLFELAKSVRASMDTLLCSKNPSDHDRAQWVREHLTPEGLPGYGLSGFASVPSDAVVDVEVAGYLTQLLR